MFLDADRASAAEFFSLDGDGGYQDFGADPDIMYASV
jgi:hypothetical protein